MTINIVLYTPHEGTPHPKIWFGLVSLFNGIWNFLGYQKKGDPGYDKKKKKLPLSGNAADL